MTDAELVRLWIEVYQLQSESWAWGAEEVADMVVLNAVCD